jgi:hypothetical protein
MPEQYYALSEAEAAALIDRKIAEVFGDLHKPEGSAKDAGDSLEKILSDYPALFPSPQPEEAP